VVELHLPVLLKVRHSCVIMNTSSRICEPVWESLSLLHFATVNLEMCHSGESVHWPLSLIDRVTHIEHIPQVEIRLGCLSLQHYLNDPN
jgi:hypothetical protein